MSCKHCQHCANEAGTKPTPINIDIQLNINADGMIMAFAKSKAGRKVVVDVVKDALANGDLQTVREAVKAAA